ncbi:glutaredoxin-like protein NrdH [Cellulosimicrobium sp. BIT-GX5]|uniref:Glutaredoxin-like protein NrdH n=1 Tax=Cellulosimicrobium composti TaxID=2672572 RepID=A0A6N7ZMY9_9MICO|nr:glutaredoxin-like protein NrdH [Cellulosimicrobium composti]
MGKKSCVQCDATYRALDKKGIEYSVVDVTQDAAALERVRELGYLQVPVVVAGDDHWSGFRPDRINALSNQAIFVPGAIADPGALALGTSDEGSLLCGESGLTLDRRPAMA